jgi:hypothetical protein
MCDVLLVVIGPRWLRMHDGASRLHDPRDWVRIEILSALERNILVIPILVEGTTMPPEADLPEELRPLARYQALFLTETNLRSELTRLVRRISAHQRALNDPGSGDVQAGSRYYPFVGRRALQSGSSQSWDILMEDRTGRGAKDLGDAIEISVADELVCQLGRAARRWPLWPAGLRATAVAAAGAGSSTSPLAAELIVALGLPATVWLAVWDLVRRSVTLRYESEDANVRWQDSPVGGGRRGLHASVRRVLHARMWRSGGSFKRVAAWEAQSFSGADRRVATARQLYGGVAHRTVRFSVAASRSVTSSTRPLGSRAPPSLSPTSRLPASSSAITRSTSCPTAYSCAKAGALALDALRRGAGGARR